VNPDVWRPCCPAGVCAYAVRPYRRSLSVSAFARSPNSDSLRPLCLGGRRGLSEVAALELMSARHVDGEPGCSSRGSSEVADRSEVGEVSARYARYSVLSVATNLPWFSAVPSQAAASSAWYAKPWAFLHGSARGDELDLEDQVVKDGLPLEPCNRDAQSHSAARGVAATARPGKLRITLRHRGPSQV
jgi:hypothetical protein